MSFTYDDNGIRTSKTANNVKHSYYLNGSLIVAEQWSDKLIVYLYDSTGMPIGMMYRTTSYAVDQWDVFWFEKNLQGDVVAIYSSNGIKVATYTYNDAWGNHTVSYSNGGVSTGAYYNPFRYRGYYYDTDLGMYYLQSRYYDPNTCRFINADGVMANVGGNILGNNLYVYCFNNPVNLIDGSGSWPKWVTDTINWIEKNIVNPVSNFISGIFHDIENFDINNTKESNVFSSYYFAGYNGTLVIITPFRASFSFGIIGLSYNHKNTTDLNHEYGHRIQLEERGWGGYIMDVALPSLTANILWRMEKLPFDYYGSPWESEADAKGGVLRYSENTPWPAGSYNSYWDLIKLFF